MSMRTTFLIAALFLLSTTAHTQVVINEVDYDQIGTDNAEFLEIKNVGDAAFPLQYLRVVFINGNNGGAAEYRTISSESWPALAPGAYFVICGNQSLTLNCDHAATPITNLIQNGPNDAIMLGSTLDDTVYDMLSYGGNVPGYTEGTGTTTQDSNGQDGLSLSRWPDGADTDNNDADFVIGCPTPGEDNEIDPVECVITTGIQGAGDASTVFVVNGEDQRLRMRFHDHSAVPVHLSVFGAEGAMLLERDLGTTANAEWTIPLDSGVRFCLVRLRAGDRTLIRRCVVQ